MSADHLGDFADWPAFAEQCGSWRSTEDPARRAGLAADPPLAWGPIAVPRALQLEDSWVRDGVDGEHLSWSVGFGPRTHAWLLRPEGVRGPLPGVLALHDHGDFKLFGKEKVADGPDPLPALAAARRLYGDRAFANALARRGFAVLVHDVFTWGSRRFDFATMRRAMAHLRGLSGLVGEGTWPDEAGSLSDGDVDRYNTLAALHEDAVERYCRVLGTSFASVIAYEDRVALSYLASRSDLRSDRIGAVGCSGGGARAVLLRATSPGVSTAVVVCMMSTYRALLARHVATHTWMLFPPGIAGVMDWPALAAVRAPEPLVVQYARGDELFPLDGMEDAHRILTRRYGEAGAPDAYVGQFFEGGHRFDEPMQDAAFSQLERLLA